MSRAAWRAFRRDVQVIFQDPYEVYNPFYRVDHVLTTPVAKFRLAASKAEARALIEKRPGAGRPAPRRDAGPLPAPVERRAAPAGHGGAGPAAEAPPDRRRRAGVDGGRVPARHHPRRRCAR